MSLVTISNQPPISLDPEMRHSGMCGFIDIQPRNMNCYSGVFLNLKTLVKLKVLGYSSIALHTRIDLQNKIYRLLND
jgi:hypothetical protein